MYNTGNVSLVVTMLHSITVLCSHTFLVVSIILNKILMGECLIVFGVVPCGVKVDEAN